MIKRIVRFVVVLPLAVILIAFAIANRGMVTISLDPINDAAPMLALDMPIYRLVFLTLIIGVALGGAAAWLAQGKWRKAARKNRDEAARWRYRAEDAAKAAETGQTALPAPRQA